MRAPLLPRSVSCLMGSALMVLLGFCLLSPAPKSAPESIKSIAPECLHPVAQTAVPGFKGGSSGREAYPGSQAGEADQPEGPIPRPPEDAPPEFREFHQWALQYVAAQGAPERQLLSGEGLRLAAIRREAMKKLIVNSPQSALRWALPQSLRQQLPREITETMEERISTRGYYGVYASFPASSHSITRIVEADGRSFQACVYGARESQPTTENAFIQGIAIDGLLAVDERRSRVVEPGERVSPDMAILPAFSPRSGARGTGLPPIPVHPAGTLSAGLRVEAGGNLYGLCCLNHLAQFEQEILAYEGITGGPVPPLNSPAPTASTGAKSVLYLRLTFPDTGLEPLSEAAANDALRQVNEWMVDSSGARLYLLPTVSPLLVLPRTETWYKNAGNTAGLRDDALAAARAAGYDGDQYHHVIFAYAGGPGSFQGLATIGGKYVWIRQFTPGTTLHELGHNFGLAHANFWETGGASIIGPGTSVEYGHTYDWMGDAKQANGDFCAPWKYRIGWLPDDMVHHIRHSGTYRLYAGDLPKQGQGRHYAFRIRKDGQRDYWGEYRPRFNPANASLVNGVILSWSPWSESGGGTALLDTTPGSTGGKADAALTIGRTLSDPEAGIHITPLAIADTMPGAMDIAVNLGTFPENRPPELKLQAGATTAVPGVPIAFAATAVDPDGDTLAYSWDFGDGTFSIDNLPAASKAWTATGDYLVRCTASDMKGGSASSSVRITLGSPVTYVLKGRVTMDDQPLSGVRVHNGLSGTNNRGAWTDSDGAYTITGLPAGAVTLTAALQGYTFTPAFANPLQAGPASPAADFRAKQLPRITISTANPFATEGELPGTIRISRTGATTGALAVTFDRFAGTAAESEYLVVPEPEFDDRSSSFLFTIPAGQAFLDLRISALIDQDPEGPETASVAIRPGSNYLIAGEASAIVTLLDNTMTIPEVTLQAVDASADEAGDEAEFRFTRTGPVGSDLKVDFAITGSAANGTDFTFTDTSVTIPAGQSFISVRISPADDGETEGAEDVILTLTGNPRYLISQSAREARILIADDDIPEVTIAATDGSAQEAGRDPATFVLTRTGNTAAPLTVFYALAGSALHGIDYSPLPGAVTIPAGSNSASITILPIDDTIGEPVQTVIAAITPANDYSPGPSGIASATIGDNDLPVVTVGVTDSTLAEPADSGRFTFTTTGSGSGNITVRYLISGTATPGSDFTPLSGTLTMGKNTTAGVAVTPVDDLLPENLENITVTIEPDPAYTVYLDRSATLNLIDNERPAVSVSAGTGASVAGEAGGPVRFYLSRQGPVTAPLSVSYLLSGTATNGVDYQSLSGTAVIPAGQTGVNVNAAVLDDGVTEGAETVTLTVIAGTAGGVGVPSATQIIEDDEIPEVSVGFAGTASAAGETAGTLSLPVTLNHPSPVPVSVNYLTSGGTATGGIDYTPAAGILTFAPGVTEQSIPLTLTADSFPEPPQTIVVELRNAWHAAISSPRHVVTINGSDPLPQVAVGFAAGTSASSEQPGLALLPVSLSSPQTSPVSVSFGVTGGTATNGGVDYTLNPGVLHFAPGETVQWITLMITDDPLNEPNETVIIALSAPSGAVISGNAIHTFTISNLTGTLAVSAGTDSGTARQAGIPSATALPAYTLQNTGDTAINWTAAADVPWAAVSTASGTLNPGEAASVFLSLEGFPEPLLPGRYSGSVNFTNITNNQGSATRAIEINVPLQAPEPAPEPAFTGGTSNLIAWEPVPGAEAYEIQRSENGHFSSLETSGWIQGTDYRFTSLPDGSRHHYRIRAWRTAADPPAGPWCPLIASIQDATPPLLELPNMTKRPVVSDSIFLFTSLVSDPGSGIRGVAVNGAPGALPAGSTAWNLSAGPLHPGENTLTVVASDNAEPANQTTKTFEVYYATDNVDFDRDGLPDAWELAHRLDLFDGGTQNPGNGALGDDDGDGMENLLEYAVNKNPALADGPVPVSFAGTGDLPSIIYSRRIHAPGIVIRMASSPDLNTWDSRPECFEQTGVSTDAGGITETVTLRPRPVPGEPVRRTQFFKLTVSPAPAP